MSTTVRTINFLPEIFQTTPNQQFLAATLDQLVQQPVLKTLRGYIGQKYGYGVKSSDHYIPELDNIRNNYQLDPAVIFNDPLTQKTTDLLTYPGLLDALKLQGGVTNNNSDLFENQFYSWDSFVDLDKLINYSEYYWIPNGPDPVPITTGNVFLTQDYVINSDYESYVFNVNSVPLENRNPTLTLIRGGTYTFEVNQSSNFWIQTAPGIGGANYTNSIIREIDGVANNGTNHGSITFTVPLSTDQDNWVFPGNIPIDLVTTLRFDQINGQILSSIDNNIDNVYQLNGKTLLFYGTPAGTIASLNQFFDEESFDENTNDTGKFDDTIYTEVNKNYYRIIILGTGSESVIQLVEQGQLPDNTKISIGYGQTFTNRNFVKNSYGEIYLIPFITANLNVLYYQDDTIGTKAGKILLIDNPVDNYLDVTDILDRSTYTSHNGVTFTNGLKVEFIGNITPKSYQGKSYYVEGVGTKIQLLLLDNFIVPEPFSQSVSSPYDFDTYPYDFFPYDETYYYPVTQDYITINRSSPNKNAWSRSNNWFHIDVLNSTIAHAPTCPNVQAAISNPDARAKRPIIEFYPNLKLFNSGVNSRGSIDYINFSETDAFNTVASATRFSPDGAQSYVYNGARIVFAGDNDPSVRNKIYVVNFAKLTGIQDPVIALSVASDGNNITYNDQFVVANGEQYTGQSFYFDGSNWKQAQFKQFINQNPLFDLFDNNENSLGDASYYPGTNFKGCTLFEYAPGTSGVDDPILGFPLTYSYVGNIGDLTFKTTLNTDQFTYVVNNKPTISSVSIGYVHSYDNTKTLTRNIGWQTTVGNSFQYQVFNFEYVGNTASFITDVLIKDSTTTKWPTIAVYVDNVLLSSSNYTVTNNKFTTVTLNTTPALNTPVTIKIYSDQVSVMGYYEIPTNLYHNPFNQAITTINLGDIRGHYASICENVPNLIGNTFGSNNYRDLGNIVPYGTSIVQHSAPLLAAASFLKNDKNNFFDALNYNASQYNIFKNLIIQTLDILDVQHLNNNVSAILDQVLKYISQGYNNNSPFYWSDMLPYGTPAAINTYTFNTDITNTIYPTITVYDFANANYKGILVYLTRNNKQIQLFKDIDYVLSTSLPAIEVTKELLPGDSITIKEYVITYGSYIPNTPTKLGFYSSFIPKVVQDATYITPNTYFIVGHDGSYTKLYGKFTEGILTDLRDRLLLEFETRIYNNLKNAHAIPITYDEIVPGQFRDTGLTHQEYLEVYAPQFLNWVGNNNINYTEQYYLSTSAKTWNYSQSSFRFNNTKIQQGNWRGMYLWLYDTCNPDTAPWEILGLVDKPHWWDEYYGIAPYTSENLVMWTDISNGYVWNYGNDYINNNRIRPDFLKIIPVDTQGNLIDPFESVVGNYDQLTFENNWVVGDVGPAEYSYLKSSTWPFDLVRLMALLKPSQFFGLGLNLDNYYYNSEFNQYLTNIRYRAPITDLTVYGTNNGTASHSYVNWIVDYSTQYGVQGATQLYQAISNIDVRLVYRCAGYTDHNLINFGVEKVSAADTTTSLIIPSENYQILLYSNQPSANIVYSSVIIQRTTNGYAVYGNGKSQLYFTVYLPQDTGFYDTVTINGNSDIVSKNYTRMIKNVPYGTQFTTNKDLLEFIKGYGLYLNDQGMQFNDIENNITVTWDQMLNEIVYWIYSGWGIGSVLNVNPAANIVTIEKSNLIVQSLTDTNNNSILNQNLIPIDIKDLSVYRIDNTLTISPLNGGDSVSYLMANLYSIEHVVVFDNYTSFNDLIFNLVTGLRTPRMVLNGKITNDWNGTLNAPGFFLNQDNVVTWQPDVKYEKGDIVKYKNNYWIANETIVQPDTVFNTSQWAKTNYNLVDKGLLPNASTRSVESELFYNSNTKNLSNDADLLSFSLIGYRPRQYIAGANINPISEVNFYKGMIPAKGTDNSISTLDGIKINNNILNYTVHENWMIQSYEYGGILNQNFIDVTLDKSMLTGNPAIVSLFSVDGVEGAQQQIPLYKIKNYGRGIYNTNILPVVDPNQYEEKFTTAGYVNLNDVFASGYTIADLNTIGVGTVYRNDYLWIANINNDWDVFTPLPINANVTKVTNNLNGTVNVTFNGPHGLLKNQNVAILNFNNLIDGYYIVTDIVNLNVISITLTLGPSVTSIVSFGMAYLLQSQRVRSTADINGLPLTNAEYTSNTVWVDNDVSGSWATYQKNINYNFEKLNPGFIPQQAFGTNVAYIPMFGYIVTDSDKGVLHQYHRSPLGIYISTGTITGPRSNSNFGYSITYNNEYLIVSSLQLTGQNEISELYVYKIPTAPQVTSVVLEQIIQIGTNSDGTTPDQVQSMALSSDGNILWVALPYYDAIEMYFQEKELHYSCTGTTLSTTTVIDSTSFTISGNQLSTILGGQRVTFVVNFTQIATLSGMTGSTTASTYAIDPYNGPYIDPTSGTSNWDRIGSYFIVTGNIYFATGTKIAFSNTDVTNSTTFTVAYTQYESGNNTTSVFVDEQFITTLTTAIPIGTHVYSVHFSDSTVYTVITATYDSHANVTTFYTVEKIKHTAVAGSIVYTAGVKFTYLAVDAGPDSVAGDKFGYSIATNSDGTKLFVGAPSAAFGPNLPAVGAVYVFDRLIETWQVQQDVHPWDVYELILPYIPLPNGKVFVNGAKLSNTQYVVYLNTIIISSTLYAGDIIVYSSANIVLNAKLTGFSGDTKTLGFDLGQARQDTLFGYSVSCNQVGSELIVGSPFAITTNGKDGAVYRFTNEGKKYGTVTGFIASNLTEPAMLFLNGYRINLERYGLLQAATTTTSTSMIIDLYSASLLPSNGTITIDNLTNTQETFTYTSVNRLTGQINLGIIVATAVVNTGTNVVVLNFSNPLTQAPFATSSSIVLSGMFPTQLNGTHTVTACTVNTVTFSIVSNAGLSTTEYVQTTGSVVSTSPLAYTHSINAILTLPLGNATNISNCINQHGIINVFAYATQDERLIIRLKSANLAPANNKLNISVFNNVVLYQLGFIAYALTQTITDPNAQTRTQFGYAVQFNESNSFVVSAPVANRYEYTTFDAVSADEHYNTVFDNNLTQFVDTEYSAGAVYMYDYLPCANESITNTGQFIFAQTCNDTDLNYGSYPYYGTSLAFNNDVVMIGNPKYQSLGKVIVYQNSKPGTQNWSLLRRPGAIVDITSINKVQIYNNINDMNLVSLDYIDPLQGKLLGAVRENIDFISNVDPASYNSPGYITGNRVWTNNQIGKIWFDTSTTKFLNYHQNDIMYNSQYWGQVFPGSTVTVYTWVQSLTPPANYADTTTGKPYNINQYSMEVGLDSNNNLVTKYYYWVQNTNTIYTLQGKKLSDTIIKQYIVNPQHSGISYFAGIQPNVYGLYNVSEFVSGTDTNLYLGFGSSQDTKSHKQYALIREGYGEDFLPGFVNPFKGYNTPTGLYEKLLDSMAGTDLNRSNIPDYRLPVMQQIGISIRPKQSFFINRLNAIKNYLKYANSILINYPVLESDNLTFLNQTDGATYSTNLYWTPVYWWATGHDSNTIISYEVPTYPALKAIQAYEGLIVSVAANSVGNSEVYLYTTGNWTRIGLQNGTLQFSSSLWDYKNNLTGFGENFFDTVLFDYFPDTETKYIIRALNEQIYTGPLLQYRNASLILLFNYIQSENIESINYLPWLNKTSFVDINYNVRELLADPTYQPDNQSLLEGYINEVKPYHTVLKEFLQTYNATDTFGGDISDFDLPPSYNTILGKFSSPQLTYNKFAGPATEYTLTDPIWQNSNEYNTWLNNFGLSFNTIYGTIITFTAAYVSKTDNIIKVQLVAGMPVTGIITINNEQIGYTNINLDTNILSGITRGLNNTNVIEHLPGSAIYIDLPGGVILNTGRGYTSIPKVTAYIDTSLYPAPTIPAVLVAEMSVDKVIGITVVNPGQGYVVTPTIVIEPSYSVTIPYENIEFSNNTLLLLIDPSNPVTLLNNDFVQVKNNSSNGNNLIPDGYYYVTLVDPISNRYLVHISFYNSHYDSLNNRHHLTFVTSNLISSDFSITLSLGARAIANMGNSKVRGINPIIKFDRTTYKSHVIPWIPNQYYSAPYISFGNMSSSPNELSLASKVGPITSSTYTHTGSGTGAQFTVYDMLMGATYSVTVLVKGLNYAVGDVITIPGTALYGVAPDNNCVITVASITGTGGISTVTVTGTAIDAQLASLQGAVLPITSVTNSNGIAVVGLNYTPSGLVPGQINNIHMYFYTVYAPYIYDDTGSGGAKIQIFRPRFDPTELRNTYYINILEQGSKYNDGDLITISGTLLGGTTPINDCRILIEYANSGGITISSVSGTAVGHFAQYFVKVIDSQTVILFNDPTMKSPVKYSQFTWTTSDYGYVPQPFSGEYSYTTSSVVSYAGQIWQCIENNNDNTFIPTKWAPLLSSDVALNALDRIEGYYNPSSSMPGKDMQKLVPGITYPNTTYRGNDFAPEDVLPIDYIIKDTNFFPTELNIVSIVYDGTKYLAIGDSLTSSVVLFSTTLTDWSIIPISDTPLGVTDIKYAYGYYIITTSNVLIPMLISFNGIDWIGQGTVEGYDKISFDSVIYDLTSLNIPAQTSLYTSLILTDTKSLAFGNSVINSYTSNWQWNTNYEFGSRLTNYIKDAIFVNGYYFNCYIGVGHGQRVSTQNTVYDTIQNYGLLMSSKDGLTWQIQKIDVSANGFNGIATSGSKVVIVGDNGSIWYSTSSGSWTQATITGTTVTDNINGVAYGNNLFVAVGNNGLILSSVDGITWTQRTNQNYITANNLNKIRYINGNYFATGSNNTILQSSNGTTTWFKISKSPTTDPYYSIKGSDFLFGYGPEELVAGVVTDVPIITVISTPGALWDMDLSEDYWIYYTGFNMVKRITTLDANYSASFANLALNPVLIGVFVLNTSKLSYRIYPNITTSGLNSYTYSIDWIAQTITLNTALPTGYSIMIEVYEVGNAMELYRSSTIYTPLLLDTHGNSIIEIDVSYQATIGATPMVIYNGNLLVYNTDYTMTSTSMGRVQLNFPTAYDMSVDYLSFSIVGNSTRLATNPNTGSGYVSINNNQYDYSIPLTEIFTNVDVSGVITIANLLPVQDPFSVNGSVDPLSHVIVEVNSVRLVYNSDYTINSVTNTINIVNYASQVWYNSNNIFAVTTYNDTSRQHMQTIIANTVSSTAGVTQIAVASPQSIYPKESISYTDATRTWVTINGLRVAPNALSFDNSNNLTITGVTINSGDEVIITAMVSTASPNGITFTVDIDKHGNPSVYNLNSSNTTWLTQGLYPGQDTIYFNNVSNLVDIVNGVPTGRVLYINGEKIMFKYVDLVQNTLSGITRGVKGTGLTGTVIPAYTIAYKINQNIMQPNQYNQIWNTTVTDNNLSPSVTFKQPLQMSTSPGANFLNSVLFER